jgi:hypothetical protein
MVFLLLSWKFQTQAAQILDGACQLTVRLFALTAVHSHLRAACQKTTVRPLGERHDRLQIDQQRRRRGRGRRRLALPPGF